jgi:hypothetical protein
MTTVPIAQGAAGTTEIVPASTGRTIVVVSYVLILDAAGTWRFETGSRALSGDMPADAKGGAAATGGNASAPLMVGDKGGNLEVVSSGGKALGHLTFYYDS